MNTIVKAIEGLWSQLSYEERDNITLAQDIARKELKKLGICNSAIGETLNLIALQLTTLILESRVKFEKCGHCIVDCPNCRITGVCEQVAVGEDILTIMQYKDRVTFLLNESLGYGLIEHLSILESLFDNINGDELHIVECTIGDYIYLNE